MEENERRNDECKLQTEEIMIPMIKTEVCSVNEGCSESKKPLEEVKSGELQKICVNQREENETRNDECELQTEPVMIPSIKTEVITDNERCSDSIKPLVEVQIGEFQNICVTEVKEEMKAESLEIEDIHLTNRTYIKEECLIEDVEVVDQNMTDVTDYDPLAAKCKVNDGQEVSHGVFIKEESEPQLVNNTFGNHFMTFMESKDQCSSGQPTVVEHSGCEHPPGKAAGSASNKPLLDEDGLCTNFSDRNLEHGTWIEHICQSFDFIERNANNMKSHSEEIKHKAKPITCQYCHYRTNYKGALQKHVISKHNFGEAPIDCPYCKFQSLSIMEVQDHIARKHAAKDLYVFYCPHCEFKARNKSNLRYHVAAKHTLVKNFSCPYCEYRCILKCNLISHAWKIHRKKVR